MAQQGARGPQQGGPGEEVVEHHPCQLLLVEAAPSPAGAPQEERNLSRLRGSQPGYICPAHTLTHTQTGSFMTVIDQQTATGELLAQ